MQVVGVAVKPPDKSFCKSSEMDCSRPHVCMCSVSTDTWMDAITCGCASHGSVLMLCTGGCSWFLWLPHIFSNTAMNSMLKISSLCQHQAPHSCWLYSLALSLTCSSSFYSTNTKQAACPVCTVLSPMQSAYSRGHLCFVITLVQCVSIVNKAKPHTIMIS